MSNKFIPPQTTTTTRTAATPLDGEILYDTDEKKLYYGDGTTVGGKAIGSPTVADNVFRIQDNTDSTKQLAFEASGITTGTTRTLTVPDSNGTVLSTDTLTDKALYYYDASSKLFKPVGIGTEGQNLIAQPSSNPPYQFATPTGGGRETLTAPRTYYIRTDGSDSNNGLTNTAGGAFLTPQKFYDTVGKLDKNGFDVTGQLGNGTYNLSSIIYPYSGIGEGKVILQGDDTTPSNVIIDAGTQRQSLLVLSGGIFRFTGIKLQASTLNALNRELIQVRDGAIVEIGKMDFGTIAGTGFSMHLWSRGGRIYLTDSYTASGSASCHYLTSVNGLISALNLPSQITVTVSGSPTFSAFIYAIKAGIFESTPSDLVFSGSATGQRYNAFLNGAIDTTGGGANYFPGNSAGTTSSGGQYV